MSSPSSPRSADVVVIGAGVIGSSIAFELSRSGRRVIVVDAGPAVGGGSTSASSGIIRYHYSTFDAALTAWEAAPAWFDLAAFLGVSDDAGMCRYVPTGSLVLDFPNTNKDTVLGHWDQIGIPYEIWDADQLQQRMPSFDVGDFAPARAIDDPEFAADPVGRIGGYYTHEAGFIDDPMLAANNFMFAAKHHGAQVLLRTRVVGVTTANGAVSGVALEGGDTIAAPVVINVAGPHSSQINALAGVVDDMNIASRALRQEVTVAEATDDFSLENGMLVSDIGLGSYFRPHLGNTVLIGGTEPECDPFEWIDDPDTFVDRPTVEGFERNVFRAARRLPSLPIPHRPVGLAALYDVADDWVPIYDKSSLPGYYMACGTSGNQFKNAPLAGQFMRRIIEHTEAGNDHDADPATIVGERTGQTINLGGFSRRRDKQTTSGTVMG